MTEQEIVSRIQGIFDESLGIAPPEPETDIIDTALLDSLGLVTLLFGIEQEFGVEIALESLEIDDFRTVASIASLIGSMELTG